MMSLFRLFPSLIIRSQNDWFHAIYAFEKNLSGCEAALSFSAKGPSIAMNRTDKPGRVHHADDYSLGQPCSHNPEPLQDGPIGFLGCQYQTVGFCFFP